MKLSQQQIQEMKEYLAYEFVWADLSPEDVLEIEDEKIIKNFKKLSGLSIEEFFTIA